MTATSMTDKHFIDWESNTFGYGYGTGEQFTVPALKRFFELLENGRSYNHRALETEFGPLAAWLLINILAHSDIIEYGTSPRQGWLTNTGQILRDYLTDKAANDLYELTAVDEYYTHCYPHHCNCSDAPCMNPLWKHEGAR